MNVGILSVDSKFKGRMNLALAKVSTWHKSQGDSVELASPMFGNYGRVYRSTIFDFTTKDATFWDCEVIDGGTGYDLTTNLPDEIEACVPDYGLFGFPHALGFTTRGCVRRCRFCVVPRKEGKFRLAGDGTIAQFWTGQKVVKLLDNNLTADPEQLRRVVDESLSLGVRLDLVCGIDARLLTSTMATDLRRVKWDKIPPIAFDHVSEEDGFRRGARLLVAAGFPKSHIHVYTIVGFDSTPEQDMHRLDVIRELGLRPFVMPFVKDDPYQSRLARWANLPQLFMSVPFDAYLKSRGAEHGNVRQQTEALL